MRILPCSCLALVLASCGAPSVPVASTSPPPAEQDEPVRVPPPRDDGRLPAGVEPESYRIELTVDPSASTFLGRVRIALRIENATRVLVLHGRKLDVKTASIRAGGRRWWAEARLRAAAHTKGDPEELLLVMDGEMPAGPAVLDIEYEAPFARGLRGLYRVHEGDTDYAFTQFEPNDARLAFPCFDEPSAKVPFEMSVTVPRGLVAVSNMPEVARTVSPTSGLVTFDFERSPPMPTYLVALGVGPFEITEGEGASPSIRLVSARGKSSLGRLAVQTAREQVALLNDYFGRPYPYPKLDLVAVPSFAAGAMENPGFVTFREELVLLDPDRASTSARRRLAGVLAHELSHMWFGDLVTMSWWDDLWLNEGFASWMGTKIVDRWRPTFGAGIAALVDKAQVMDADTLETARRVRQPVRSTSEALEAFDGITYVKGMAVLSMIERWIGPETFQRGVRSYLAAHEWGNATAADLFAALGTASGRDVAAVMDTFLDQTGVPLVEVERTCRPKPTLTVTQAEHLPLRPGGAAPGSKRWRFPVCVRFDTGPRADPGRACVLLEGPSANIELGTSRCPRWVHANAAAAGYYRYRLDGPSLDALLAAGPAALSVAERTDLVSDAWALVSSGELGADAYLSMLEKLRAKGQRAIWEQVVDALRSIGRDMVSEQLQPSFRRYVADVLGREARRLGWHARAGETEDARLERRLVLTAFGSLARDRATLERARELGARWLSDPASVEADSAAIAVPLAADAGDRALFERLRARLVSARTPEERLIALSGLTGLSAPPLVERTLGLTLDGTIKAQDLRYVFGPLFSRRDTRSVAYAWVRSHFDELAKRLPSFVVGRFVWVAAGLCDEDRVQEARDFFTPRLKKIEGADRHLRQAVEAGRRCAARKKHHRSRVEAWLARRSGSRAVPTKGTTQ